MDFPLLRCVALLNLRGHGIQGLQIVGLGGARSPADAVPAGTTAQEDHLIAGGRGKAHHIGGRGRPHHGPHLHMLGSISLVVDLADHAGGQADLVAIGGVARRRSDRQLALGELALQRLAHRIPHVAAAGEAHGLIYIGAAGQGIPNGPADAGGRAAKGLDLSGMVVGFILEHEKPVLMLSVHSGLYLD